MRKHSETLLLLSTHTRRTTDTLTHKHTDKSTQSIRLLFDAFQPGKSHHVFEARLLLQDATDAHVRVAPSLSRRLDELVNSQRAQARRWASCWVQNWIGPIRRGACCLGFVTDDECQWWVSIFVLMIGFWCEPGECVARWRWGGTGGTSQSRGGRRYRFFLSRASRICWLGFFCSVSPDRLQHVNASCSAVFEFLKTRTKL